MEFLDKLSRGLTKGLLVIAGVLLVVMIVLTCTNIFLRLVWVPVKGTFELMGFFGAIITSFALGYTQLKKGHIAIDIVVVQFSKKTQYFLNGFNYLICAIFFCLVGWRTVKWAGTLWEEGEVTETLRIIFYPFTYAVALGCFILATVLLIDLLKLIATREGA